MSDRPYNEADTRAKLIDPAIREKGWAEDLIRREVTPGPILIQNGRAFRSSTGRIDYVLRVKANAGTQPVALALLEAKREGLSPNHGLDQAKRYADATRQNVYFVFSSNGHRFVEFDRLTKITSSPKPMADFPTPEELRHRFEKKVDLSLETPEASPLLQPYPNGEGTRRYYQDAAIRAVLQKLARCEISQKLPRALLSMATGSGKTFIATYMLKKIADAGRLRRALFVCDRDELRAQALRAFQNVFGADAAEVYRSSDGKNNAQNARIHIATYQTLLTVSAEKPENFLVENYPENYFSHIVIDECHRSAWGHWADILRRNESGAHIGLTATPRIFHSPETTDDSQRDHEITAHNHRYFGEPVYEYSMLHAMEDGYLAKCEVQKNIVNLDEAGITKSEIIERNPVDPVTGELIPADEVKNHYAKTQYEATLQLPERVRSMCESLFAHLVATGGPKQKTVVFCVRDQHADSVAICLNNLYARWCALNKETPCDFFAFKCTAASQGNDQLPDFRGSHGSHFVATTVDLLTTGVDIPCLRNIVFFKYVNSPIIFFQMVGRGTRIDNYSGKLSFRVYDYTDATRLFGESDSFVSAPRASQRETSISTSPIEGVAAITELQVEGFTVQITDAGHSILIDENGIPTLISMEEYRGRLGTRLLDSTKTLREFRDKWIVQPSRCKLLSGLADSGYPTGVVYHDRKDYDLYDVLGEIGWGIIPRTKTERADMFTLNNSEWLQQLPLQTARVIRSFIKQFEIGGTDSLENPHIFGMPDVVGAGGIDALKIVGDPQRLLHETKRRMFAG